MEKVGEDGGRTVRVKLDGKPCKFEGCDGEGGIGLEEFRELAVGLGEVEF